MDKLTAWFFDPDALRRTGKPHKIACDGCIKGHGLEAKETDVVGVVYCFKFADKSGAVGYSGACHLCGHQVKMHITGEPRPKHYPDPPRLSAWIEAHGKDSLLKKG